MNRKKSYKRILSWLPIILVVMTLGLTGCKRIGARITSMARGKFFRWVRYEVGGARNFSMGSSQIKTGYRVVGYEPSWLIYDSLYQSFPFEMMTDLVVGEYDVNPYTGFSRFDSSKKAFLNKGIIETAIEQNDDIGLLLALTYYGDFGNQFTFMSDQARKNLIKSVDGLIDEMRLKRDDETSNKVGVLIDFHGVPPQFNRDFAEFVSRLKSGIENEAEEEECLVYLTIPLRDEMGFYDSEYISKKIRHSVDYYLIRGHNFDAVREGEQPGPLVKIRPVSDTIPSDGYDVDSSLKYYEKVAHFPLDSMILELPFYGRNWSGDSSGLTTNRPLRSISELYNHQEVSVVEYDADSSGAYFAMGDSIFWFEDTLTFARKFEWTRKRGIAGVGFYGLGYGNILDETYRNRIWDSLAEQFGETPPRLLFPGISFLLSFIILGVFASTISFWETRYALRSKKMKMVYYIFLILIVIAAMILCFFDLSMIPLRWKIGILVLLIMVPLVRFLKKAIKL